jgi:hypothetical protein
MKALLCGDDTKNSSWLNRLYVDSYGPLESSLYLFLEFVFVSNTAFSFLYY